MPSHHSLTIAIKTLGCKLNQFEGEQIRSQLTAWGCTFVPFETLADVYIINSCTVTAKTDSVCRRLIRHARKLSAQATIVVTGCYAEAAPEALAAIPEADLVIGNTGKAGLPEAIMQRLGLLAPPANPSDVAPAPYGDAGAMVDEFAGHTRAFVKVQEGCDAHCTYCIIPSVRGSSRSVPPEAVRQQVSRLIAAGHPEVVLIGIHLGKYGLDLPGAPDLADLISELCDLPGLGRIRLSSIEPREVTEPLIALVTGHPKVCRHLHIPLQSGCDSVLARMGRPYDTVFYADLLASIVARDPDVCLGSDVMVGFPGETEDEFEATRRLVEALPLSHLHVFAYSRRPGTPAADMPDQVDPRCKHQRSQTLRTLADRKRAAFAAAMVGKPLTAVMERPAPEAPELLEGLTDNYLRILAPANPTDQSHLLRIQVTSSESDLLRGQPLRP